jgi:hypothetical protein
MVVGGQIEYGTVGEWAGAVAAGLAIFAAVWLAAHSERRAAGRAALGQASQVIVRSSWSSPTTLRVQVRNFSSSVLRSVELRVEWNTNAGRAPMSGELDYMAWSGQTSIAGLHHLQPAEDDAWIDFERPANDPGSPRATVWWMDENGLYWRAHDGGLPAKVKGLPYIRPEDYDDAAC